MAGSYFPASGGQIIQPQHVDLLATNQAWLGTDTGSAGSVSIPTTYVLTFNGTAPNYNSISALGSAQTGQQIDFVAKNSSAAAGATLQINSLTAVPILKMGGQSQLGVGDITAGQMVSVIFNYNSSGSPRFEFMSSGVNNTASSQSTFVGFNSGQFTTTAGNNDCFFGYESGLNNTSGSNNTFCGASSGISNTTGSLNSFFGTVAGQANTTGSENCFIGLSAGQSNTTGGANTCLGFGSGCGSSPSVTDAECTYLGFFAGRASSVPSGTSLTNAMALGNGAAVAASNVIALGNSAVVEVQAGGGNAIMNSIGQRCNQVEVAAGSSGTFFAQGVGSAAIFHVVALLNGFGWCFAELYFYATLNLQLSRYIAQTNGLGLTMLSSNSASSGNVGLYLSNSGSTSNTITVYNGTSYNLFIAINQLAGF